MSMNAEAQTMVATESLGSRLRRTREERGATRQEVSAALRLPLATIESMETDRLERLGAAIYVKGHLRSYLRWLDLPEVLAEGATHAVAQEPPVLHSSASVPRSRVLLDRYAVRAVYVVLTLSIILPGLWVAMQRPAGTPAANTRVLEQAPLPVQPATQPAALPVAPAASAAAGELHADESEQAQTVVASIAPFYQDDQRAGVETAPAAAAAAADDSGWTLHFSGDSWVEVTAVDGRRLEYGMFHNGDRLSFSAGTAAHVALGNASAASLRRKGEAVDVSPFQRANVARFAVSSDGSLKADNR